MDLAGILARLNGSAGNQTQSPASGAPGTHYQPPAVSSPIASPLATNQAPRQPQDILSAKTSNVNTPINGNTGTSTLGSGSDLLGLLRSRQASQQNVAAPQQMNAQHVEPQLSHSHRPVSAADLVAGFARKQPSIGSITSPTVAAPSSSRPDLRGEASSSSTNPQDFLLKLLHQSKPEAASPAVALKSPEPKTNIVPVSSPSTNALASHYLQQAILPGFTRASDSPSLNAEGTETSVHLTSVEHDIPGQSQAAETTAAAPVFGESITGVTAFAPVQSAQKGNVFTYVNPFEQLSRASPANVSQHATAPVADVKHVPHEKHAREPSSNLTPVPVIKARKMMSNDTPSSPTRAGPARETVAEAVDEVGEQVDKQVEEALAKLNIQATAAPATSENNIATVKADSEKSVDSLVATHWEDDVENKEQKLAQVFVMPMKPFVSIDVGTLEEHPVVIHDSKILTIARMRKPFDQLDRTLVACTSRFIAYALKSGGLRLIRQDSGKYKQLFADSDERLFNLSIARSRSVVAPGAEKREVETVLGTGVKGTVFWSPLTSMTGGSNTPKHGVTSADDDRGFLFPPVPASDEQTSSGQLKTRVKPSTRSPDFFAYGRGQNIHIVWPLLARSKAYTDLKTGICDSNKYLRDDDLKILTGKAAKDFAFSSDDTVIASLDKAGKLKFWDIRSLTKPEFKSELRAGVVAEVKTPIMTLNTTLPSEKSWPTSVMFVDREKPMTRGYALRYMIIGLKQNHTIQLWDLALSKPVQEINFPHNDESDAICSLAFNARGNMLAVGHPTRNSIYILNLSLPVYSQAPMNQAKYMSMIAEKNKNLPPVNSTVIFTSIREYSLGTRGTLRSLDLMLDVPVPDEQASPADESIMTLICMHSEAIFEFGMSRELLGWNARGKPINQVDALESKAISLHELKQPLQEDGPASGDSSTPSVASNKESPIKGDTAPSESVLSASTAANEARTIDAAEMPAPRRDHESDKIKLVASTEKDKKKKKKAEKDVKATASVPNAAGQSKITKEISRSSLETEPEAEVVNTPAKAQTRRTLILPREESNASSEAIKQLEASLTTDVTRVLNDSFNALYKRMAEDKRAWDAAGVAKQDTLLRLFSQTMRENFEGHVTTTIVDAVNKAQSNFKESINSTVDRSVTTTMSNAVKGTLQREIEKTVEHSLTKAFKEGAFIRGLGDALGKHSTDLLSKALPIAFAELAPVINSNVINALRQSTADVQHVVAEQFQRYEVRHSQDSETINRLTSQVAALTTALSTIASEQRQFQNEMRLQFSQVQRPSSVAQQSFNRTVGHGSEASTDIKPSASVQQAHLQRRASPAPLSEEAKELQVIRNFLQEGKFDDAFVQGVLFDQLFIHLGPRALEHATPLVVLSVTAAVSFSIESNMAQRLDWLNHAMNLLDPANAEYESVLPKIMDVIVHRLDGALANMTQGNANSSLYLRVNETKRRAQIMKNQAGR